jgi:hypothetical protein
MSPPSAEKILFLKMEVGRSPETVSFRMATRRHNAEDCDLTYAKFEKKFCLLCTKNFVIDFFFFVKYLHSCSFVRHIVTCDRHKKRKHQVKDSENICFYLFVVLLNCF